MRHIVIDLFAPLGLSCSQLIIFTIFPILKEQFLPSFYSLAFKIKFIFSQLFQKGSGFLASRSWNLCASLLIDTTIAPADTELCKDADVSRRSFHCHYIIAVYQSKWLYIHNRGQPHILQQATNKVYNIRISPAFGFGPEGVVPVKEGCFASEIWFTEKGPDRIRIF